MMIAMELEGCNRHDICVNSTSHDDWHPRVLAIKSKANASWWHRPEGTMSPAGITFDYIFNNNFLCVRDPSQYIKQRDRHVLWLLTMGLISGSQGLIFLPLEMILGGWHF